jgi:hypothetical protein
MSLVAAAHFSKKQIPFWDDRKNDKSKNKSRLDSKSKCNTLFAAGVLHEEALPSFISGGAESDSDSVVDGLDSGGYSRRSPAGAFDGIA